MWFKKKRIVMKRFPLSQLKKAEFAAFLIETGPSFKGDKYSIKVGLGLAKFTYHPTDYVVEWPSVGTLEYAYASKDLSDEVFRDILEICRQS
ncbi:hypothetical protein [Psychrobacillus sp. FSL K6-1464]|uniref:hypothetical protein n=2 Tax=unclassified Psychrobacillus TaxID=2636677 RepID=UPI0030F4BE47